ncbi:Rossmann-like alpha/beta/alpha sandwich fold containing protein [Quillaja saponaria]|uniref:Rossmann-like alpha/beta/alpha sandwich fold containing protein n=1 Tax=Quillaja saponaria TaxID=32244 RepID=A0AAD7L851_QUISA|nr:Rossmann-like alpha/beta/alpha sandwich fold containing protein [Quillaja saponaria]
MAFAHHLLAVPVETSKHLKTPILMPSSSSSSGSLFSVTFSSTRLRSKAPKLCIFRGFHRIGHRAKAKPQEPEVSVATDAFTQFKHLLLPITDRNPYLSEGTRQAIATTTALAKKYGADITVVVIDEKQKESLPEHEKQISGIHWHLSEGGFEEYKMLERLGEGGNKPTAIIGEVADDLNLDLVVISMEAIHTKHVDANLLAEFIPCPVMLLPL